MEAKVTDQTLRARSVELRRHVIERSKAANIGHIGSGLSIADILTALYGRVLAVDDLGAPDRDRFVLSKGHAALALYVALHQAGHLSAEQLEGFCTPGSELTGHPEHTLAGVEFSTGSLGHGLGYGAGDALAARLQESPHRSFVLLSDAELNEGSIWEAVMFAAHHELSSLVAIIDANGQQALGHTSEVLDLEPLDERWASFGWDVHTVDGNDPDAIAALLEVLDYVSGPPHAVIARTTFGSGVSFMAGTIDWHYLPMDDQQYEQALAELDALEAEAQ